MYRFFDCIELFNIKYNENQIINNRSKELLILENENDNQINAYQRKSREVKYYISTSVCHIPYVNPFTPAIRRIFITYNDTGCNEGVPFIKLLFDANAHQYILHMDMRVLEQFAKLHNISKPMEKIQCCYRQIIRSGSGYYADDKYKLLPCTNFYRDLMVPVHINSLIVDCSLGKKYKKFHQSVFYMVQVKHKPKKSQKLTLAQLSPVLATPVRRKPSIILIGIDSLSRINIRRTMPKTFEYLQEKKWFELLGYNKIGDNTFPNLMALLTGKNDATAYKLCNPTKIGVLDKCNFIWWEFKKQGYYTAYAEDTVHISTFNYIKRGFAKPPTDYYFRPTALALERELKPSKMWGLNYCIANRQYGEYIYDVGVQFALRFHREAHFGLFWTNSFSHNSYNAPSRMDLKMLQYFKQFELQGTFEDAIVMFFSDHGCRWGPLLEQPDGFLESRLPMFFISLPRWFRNQYPSFVERLKINQKRLTSPYDIYMTFQHILKLNDPNYKITPASGCSNCQSLFDPIPENRACSHAGIPQKWCTCKPFKVISLSNYKLRTITKDIINKINEFIAKKRLQVKCLKLRLKKITMIKTPSISKNDKEILYVIDFSVSPRVRPPATFSASVIYETEKKSLKISLEDILRTSKYENTAQCVSDVETKKFCLCRKKYK